jgi:hypothetical protein
MSSSSLSLLLSTDLHAQIHYFMTLRNFAIQNRIPFHEPKIFQKYKDIKEKESASSCSLRIGIWKPSAISVPAAAAHSSLFQNPIQVAIKMIHYQEIFETRLKKNKFDHSRADQLTRLDIHAMRNEIYIYLMIIHFLLRTAATPCLITMISHSLQNRDPISKEPSIIKYIALEHQQYTFKKYALELYPSQFLHVVTPGFLFMLIYTLACFQLCGLQHNDLHISNYFIELYNPPIPEIIFRTSETEAVILRNVYYVPKIYDYDRSALFRTNISSFAESRQQQNQNQNTAPMAATPTIATTTTVAAAATPILPLLFSDPIHKTTESVNRERLFHNINNVPNPNWDLAVLLIGFVRAAEIHYQKQTKTNPTNLKELITTYYLTPTNHTFQIITQLLDCLKVFPLPVQSDARNPKRKIYLMHSEQNQLIYPVSNRYSPYCKKVIFEEEQKRKKKKNKNNMKERQERKIKMIYYDVTPFANGIPIMNADCNPLNIIKSHHLRTFFGSSSSNNGNFQIVKWNSKKYENSRNNVFQLPSFSY